MFNYIKKNKTLIVMTFILLIIIIGGFFYSHSQKQRWDCLEKIVYADNVYIYDNFKDGTIQAKRNMLSKLGSNLIWNGNKLIINNKISINKLVERIQSIKLEYPRFGIKTFLTAQGLNEKTSEFSLVNSTLLRG